MSDYSARGVITDGYGTFQVEEFAIAEPGPNEVLIRIAVSGVCHTDLDHTNWKEPLILGHEGAGVVEALGTDVSDLDRGERVMLNWAIPCGKCFQCRLGAQNLCEHRPRVAADKFKHRYPTLQPMFHLGTMASLALVPSKAVIPIPDDLPFEAAAVLGCSVMTGFGSVVNVAKVRPGSSVVVIGSGGVGLAVIQSARYAGATQIIAIDINDSKLSLARAAGATETVLASRKDDGLRKATASIIKMTSNRGADYAFECTAVPSLGVSPLGMVRRGGIAVGVSGIEQTIEANMGLFEFDKWYINPLYGACVPSRDFPILFSLCKEGNLNAESLIDSRYRLEEVDMAFRKLSNGSAGKSVIIF